MIVKKHTNGSRILVAICDDELLNKKFENRNCILDLTSKFFRGEKIGEKELKELLEKADSLYAVGKRCIDFLIQNQIIEKESVLKIEDVPYAFMVKI